MLITKELLEDWDFPEVMINNFKRKCLNGAELKEVLNIFKEDTEFLYQLKEVFSFTEQEINIYNKILKIVNSIYVYNSIKIRNSKYIQKSDTVVDSENVEKSKNIYRSNMIDNCIDVEDSSYCKDSENIIKGYCNFNSKYTEESLFIINSSFVKNGKDIFDSKSIRNCVGIKSCINCENVSYCKNCHNLKNCLFCYNINDKEYHIFNKPVSKELFEMIVQMSEIFTRNFDTIGLRQFYLNTTVFFFNDTIDKMLYQNYQKLDNIAQAMPYYDADIYSNIIL